MKRLVACVVGLLFVCVAEAGAREHSLVPGKWALQFGIASDFTVGAFTAGSVTAKRHLSSKAALRAALEIGGSSGESTSDAPNSPEIKLYDSRIDVRLAVMYQRYLTPGSDLAAFWGLGVFGAYDDSDAERKREESRTFEHRRAWSTGLTFGVGGEWFATRTISFHAEFRGDGSYRKGETSRDFWRSGARNTRTKSEFTRWQFDLARQAIFGLSLYF